MEIDVAEWWGLDDAAAERFVSSVAREAGATLIEVRWQEYAGRRGRVALFDVQGERFAFVPGGEVQVGFDASDFVPSENELESFESEEWTPVEDIAEYVQLMTSPPRVVTMPSLLVAVDVMEAGKVRVPPDHPRIVELVGTSLPIWETDRPGTHRRIRWSRTAEVNVAADGSVEQAWLLDVPLYSDEVTRLAGIGQRLLSPDEWEHACGAGASTLFRWGDFYPDADPWAAGDDGAHREPNAFGLNIGQNPYRAERTADPAVNCGGDGGVSACGGSSWFVCWLTLATAYRDATRDSTDPHRDEKYRGQLLVRPAIPLA